MRKYKDVKNLEIFSVNSNKIIKFGSLADMKNWYADVVDG